MRVKHKAIAALHSNMQWHKYYVARFNKTQHEDAAVLAMLYLFRALRDGEVA